MRNAKMAELLDLGFKKAKRNVKSAPPVAPAAAADEELVASAADLPDETDDGLPEVENGAGKTLRVVMAVNTSPRPAARPGSVTQTATQMDDAVAAMANDIANQFAATSTEVAAAPPPETLPTETAAVEIEVAAENTSAAAPEAQTLDAQAAQLADLADNAEEPAKEMVLSVSAAPAAPQQIELVSSPVPPKHKAPIYDNATVVAEAEQPSQTTEVVTRISTSGGGGWGINIGRYNTRGEAERVLMRTLLTEDATLGTALRKIVERGGVYDADFLGLNQDQADLACRRLQSRGVQCFTMGP
jgi:D-alanyl-D-alanine carboxypeptidase